VAFDVVENSFLGHGKPFICGSNLSMADIHIGWVLQRALQYYATDSQPDAKSQMSKEFPKTISW
jgi:glutathione S-transferase